MHLLFFLLKILPYWIAQYIGAFFGAVVVYGVYFGMQIIITAKCYSSYYNSITGSIPHTGLQ
jgi:glycerol uptake facilitator-like aquaporin